jgi:hypothetical protein
VLVGRLISQRASRRHQYVTAEAHHGVILVSATIRSSVRSGSAVLQIAQTLLA